MTKRIFLFVFAALFAANAWAEPVDYPTNKDGSTITGVLTAGFDPLDSAGNGPVIPYPFSLLYLDLDTFGITDYTLNLDVEDPNNYRDPAVVLSAMDGFSTTEKWTARFLDGAARGRPPGEIDPDSVVPGHSVRVFQVTTTNLLVVTGIVRELQPYADYVTAVAPGGILAIIPTRPLQEMTNYMAVLTNDITDTRGNNATPDRTYFLAKRQEPWVDADGNSTYALIPDDLAQTLSNVVQPVVHSMEAAAASAGMVREDIIMAWTMQTQSITWVLKNLRSIAKPAPTTIVPTGKNTAEVGGAGLADIYAGIITLPYYSGVPSAENPVAPLTDVWRAKPGAYIPPFDQALPDKTSTNITFANPFPVLTDMQTVPVLMTVPSAASGHSKPAAGWPVVIFAHGLRGDRTQMLRMADAAASQGYAVIAIDAPLHGIRKEDGPPLSLLYIENTPFADVANERHFDVDYINNATLALEPDGISDPSGIHIINFGNLLATRDHWRQFQADASVLALSVPSISIDGDVLPDLDGSNIQFASISGGSVLGPAFVATEPLVNSAFLSVPMGGVARGLEASPYYGPQIRAVLSNLAGLEPGTANYEQYFLVWQTAVDPADPINWAGELVRHNNVLLHEVINDQVNPNFVPTAPLSGTEPLIRAMGLTGYSSTQMDPNGLDLVGRFVPPAEHGSWLVPDYSPAAWAEMQKQFASWLASRGTAVLVEDAATMVPAAAPAAERAVSPKTKATPPAKKPLPLIPKGDQRD